MKPSIFGFFEYVLNDDREWSITPIISSDLNYIESHFTKMVQNIKKQDPHYLFTLKEQITVENPQPLPEYYTSTFSRKDVLVIKESFWKHTETDQQGVLFIFGLVDSKETHI